MTWRVVAGISMSFTRLTIAFGSKWRALGCRFRIQTMWYVVCECDCGITKAVSVAHLKSGASVSCGCHRDAVLVKRVTTHGLSQKMTCEFKIWKGIRKRCHCKTSKAYKNYGGRGITICDRWSDFGCFIADMGPRPSSKHSVDRFPNNNGNYEPGNCRWAIAHEQSRNTRTNHNLTIDGETMCIVDWSRRAGIGRATIRERLKRGASPREAVFHVGKFVKSAN